LALRADLLVAALGSAAAVGSMAAIGRSIESSNNQSRAEVLGGAEFTARAYMDDAVPEGGAPMGPRVGVRLGYRRAGELFFWPKRTSNGSGVETNHSNRKRNRERSQLAQHGFLPDLMAPGPYQAPSMLFLASRLVKIFLQKRPRTF
jgi:hypothetical protein